MTIRTQHTGIDPFEDHLDGLLAKIAFILQLPPSFHEKATDRYKAVREYLEGTAAFQDQIEHFYAQGSMAIDATISTRGTEDEYDIDIVAQLGGRFLTMSPLEILKELERSLNGYRGMRAVRQTRCVTLGYADNMHLDITPALRDVGTAERQSRIMHAKGPNTSADDDEIPMNAFGFAQWYKDRTPFELRVHEAFKRRWQDEGILSTRADAEVDEVDEQADFVVKNTATLALQLLKRYRNIIYAGRSGRMPPSVMLAYYAGLMAMPGLRLSDMLIRICEAIVHDIEVAETKGMLLHVENPCYSKDIFTDRWPSDRSQQVGFSNDLKSLLEGLRRARKGLLMPDALRDWLRETFGDLVVTEAVRRLSEATGKSVRESQQSYTRTGAFILPTATGASPAMASPVSATKHTFFGKIIK
ncbi:nucleotidyltransferase domain-containing protein [Brucella sp. LJL56]